MKRMIPDYYPAFRCIAAACAHSCCVGWEIDIDEQTLALYDAVPGPFGDRLTRSILRTEEGAYFCLDREERCPFLNRSGLCDIISTLGEGALCQICDDHPRFRNDLSDRTEVGLGLCCEAAASLILSRKAPMRLLTDGDDGGEEQLTGWEHELLSMRDRALDLLQDRTKPIRDRAAELLALCGARIPERSPAEWAQIYLSLERLDEGWTVLLQELSAATETRELVGEWDTVFEQLLCYFVYRYFPGAQNPAELSARAGFAVLSYQTVHALCALRERLSLPVIVEFARMYSSEIEYSCENVAYLLQLLTED